MTQLALTVNGERVSAEVEPRLHLGDFLREQFRLTGTHLGCEHGVCGACTVLLDGVPVRSCVTLALACDGADVRSIEGFADDSVMAALRTAFSEKHGLQCGFCTPGMLITARDIVLRLPGIDERRLREELAGNLCRCTGYTGIVEAVKAVLADRPVTTATPPRPQPVAAASAAFTAPAPAPMEFARAPVRTSGEEETRAGWSRFEERFDLALPPDAVWAALKDFALVAACIPGAELLERNGAQAKGRMKVKLGPIATGFVGSAAVDYDEASRTARVRGAGNDRGSGTRTTAEATYGVTPVPQGSRVALSVSYNLQGPLAQFSRSGLAQEVGRRLVREFARNLGARLTTGGAVAAEPAALDGGQLLLAALRAWLRGLWQRLTGS